jgi:hypothetical protein
MKVKITKQESKVRKGQVLTIVEIEKDGKTIDEVGRTYGNSTNLINKANQFIKLGGN